MQNQTDKTTKAIINPIPYPVQLVLDNYLDRDFGSTAKSLETIFDGFMDSDLAQSVGNDLGGIWFDYKTIMQLVKDMDNARLAMNF
jgi:hypothetical protein